MLKKVQRFFSNHTQCDHCGKSFRSNHGLAVHMGRMKKDKNHKKQDFKPWRLGYDGYVQG